MQIITDVSQRTPEPAVLTIGNFDGLHLGHQQLIAALKSRAAELGVLSVVLTFNPHTRRVVRPDAPVSLITPLPEKLAVLADLGVDQTVVLDFNKELASWDARRFLTWLRQTLPFVELWVGEGFALGHHRTGSTEVLAELGEELGFKLNIFHPLEINGLVVSSTAVREALAIGDVPQAARLLGRYFSLLGTVVHGEKRGRELGFPTANIQVDEFQALPADGIYATRVFRPKTGETLASITSIGNRPTFGPSERLIEVFILNFSGDLYDEQLEVQFIEYLRPQEKYNNIDDLITQMNLDTQNASKILASLSDGAGSREPSAG